MARRARVAPGGLVYNVLNRSVAARPLFRKEADYEAFERVMVETHQRHATRNLAWRVMQNRWQFVVGPRTEGERPADWARLGNEPLPQKEVGRCDPVLTFVPPGPIRIDGPLQKLSAHR